ENAPGRVEMAARIDRQTLRQKTGVSKLRHLAWPLGVLGLLIPAATATLVFLNRSAIHSIDQASPIGVILPIGFSLIGALLASRRTQSPIGWIFLGIAIIGGLPDLATQYVFRNEHFHRLPFVVWVAWLQSWVI